MRKTIAFLFSAISFNAACADERSYSFVETSYVAISSSGLSSPTLEGAGIRGSMAIGQQWYVLADYEEIGEDVFIFSAESKIGHVGLGFHAPISENTDFFVDASYAYHEFSIGGAFFDFEDRGYRARLGARASFGKRWEGSLGLSHTNLDGGFSESSLILGGQFKLSKIFGLTTEIASGDDTRYRVGVRASF